MATEFDDSDTDLEDLTEDFDASDVAEDDPDILTSPEGTPMGDLGTGAPSLLINLLDYSTDSFQVLELTNVFHYLFGLDSVDGAGLIEREFDINLIIRSLWVVEVLYYSPTVGGFLLISPSALTDFVKVVFLDQRNWALIALYDYIDQSRHTGVRHFTLHERLRVIELLKNSTRAFEYFFFRFSDFTDGVFLYLTFLFTTYNV